MRIVAIGTLYVGTRSRHRFARIVPPRVAAWIMRTEFIDFRPHVRAGDLTVMATEAIILFVLKNQESLVTARSVWSVATSARVLRNAAEWPVIH